MVQRDNRHFQYQPDNISVVYSVNTYCIYIFFYNVEDIIYSEEYNETTESFNYFSAL